MDLGVRAQESSLKSIFGPSERLCMPPYQRSYSWTEREAGELLTDLLDAAETGTPHFVGAVVLNRGTEEGLLEIVDGQQRLTTCVLLLAALHRAGAAGVAAAVSELAKLEKLLLN